MALSSCTTITHRSAVQQLQKPFGVRDFAGKRFAASFSLRIGSPPIGLPLLVQLTHRNRPGRMKVDGGCSSAAPGQLPNRPFRPLVMPSPASFSTPPAPPEPSSFFLVLLPDLAS